jgi:hypothetical protein
MKNDDADYRVIEMKQLQEIDGRGGVTQKHLSNISYKTSYSLARKVLFDSVSVAASSTRLPNTLCLLTYHTPSRCQGLL